jgi:uncharacterized membrane protein YfcA
LPFDLSALAGALALFAVAVAAGALNALSGGGTFLVFPSLLLAGVPAISANATTTAALWPGVVSSAYAYRPELKYTPLHLAIALALVSLFGGALGALLLLGTPSSVFERVVPYLVLIATAIFGFGPRLSGRWAGAATVGVGREDRARLLALMGIQLLISLYGGYFGGGVGILILAALSFFGLRRYHHANGLRTTLSASVNSVAFLTFVLAGAVAWREALIMVTGAVLGGYGAVSFLRRLPDAVLRRAVIAVGLLVTVYLFVRAYG